MNEHKSEIDTLREWIAKLSVEVQESMQASNYSMLIIIALLGLILYKVW